MEGRTLLKGVIGVTKAGSAIDTYAHDRVFSELMEEEPVDAGSVEFRS